MGFAESVRTCLREKYFTFSGRASRSEYWYYNLFIALVMAALIGILALISGGDFFSAFASGSLPGWLLGLFGIVFVAIYIPVISVMVRRYHDRNLSGWWVLAVMVLSNVPYLGIAVGIVSFIITVLKGTEGENRFGPDPLVAQNSAEVFA